MTQKVFWDDPYQTVLDTRVAAVEGCDVRLESTIFFAFSGGQESDNGTIGGVPVLSASKEGLEIIYGLPESHGLALGQEVRVEIDWARRYRLMRLHFAAEIVLELFYQKWPDIEKVGAHVAADKARLDFLLSESVTPFLPVFEGEANRIIAADLPITTAFDDPQAQKRYWQVEGFARVPCGGTHVKTTGEVGPIKLKRNNIGRGKERVEITLV